MINNVKMLAAAAAVATLPLAASAATVNEAHSVNLDENFYSFSTTLNSADDGAMFTFTVTEALRISTISVSGTGTTADIQSTRFQIVNPNFGPSPFQSFTLGNGSGGGSAFVPGQTYEAGDVFTVEFTETADSPISYTVSFPVAAVPVPAAGLLLLGALGGIAGLRRRKKA